MEPLYATTLPCLVIIGLMEVEIKCFWFVMWPNKETLFKKFADQFHLLRIIFDNNTKVRMNHFDISVSVNADRDIKMVHSLSV